MVDGWGVVLCLVSLAIGLAMLWAAAVSHGEGERWATRRLLILGPALALPYLLVGLADFPYRPLITGLLLGGPVVAGIILLLPLPTPDLTHGDTPTHQIDERNIMFARNRLQPGTERFTDYYRAHPDKKALDDKFRAKPGLGAPGSRYYNPYHFAAMDASFMSVEAFHAILGREPAAATVPADAAAMTDFIKAWGKQLGAVSVGMTVLKDYHVYSHRGRTEPYGDPLECQHQYAIAFTVEMDKHQLDYAPASPAVMETAQQYLNAGAIAVQVAAFIQNLGYPARAHIDGNYEVVCPLVARDAGLGEIGRMGLLMTPELGPRIRLAVVTTDLPLVAGERRHDNAMIDFCNRCEKCATICPSRAIPFGDRTAIDGVKRWQINQEACFTVWCTFGTDCGRCMQVCPYSHPDNLLHNGVRWGIAHAPLFRRLAVRLDDFLYGAKPTPLPVDGWVKIDEPEL